MGLTRWQFSCCSGDASLGGRYHTQRTKDDQKCRNQMATCCHRNTISPLSVVARALSALTARFTMPVDLGYTVRSICPLRKVDRHYTGDGKIGLSGSRGTEVTSTEPTRIGD